MDDDDDAGGAAGSDRRFNRPDGARGLADHADARVRQTAIMLTRCTSVSVSSNNSAAQLRRGRTNQ
jgi:hypothetical protein